MNEDIVVGKESNDLRNCFANDKDGNSCLKCLSVEVLEDVSNTLADFDTTNGGISSRYTSLYLICENGPSLVPIDDPKIVVLKKRMIFGKEVMHAEPYAPCPKGYIGWMMGGNFIHTSDSRFGQMVGFYGAVALHDRKETHQQYISYD